MKRGTCYVYIVANPWSRVLYTGMTCDLLSRMGQHRRGEVEGFTKRYRATNLVYYEEKDGPKAAIEREKQIKSWKRARKIDLIESVNPDWRDLSAGWFDG